MNRLIDNTYLHAVGRCLKGQAHGIGDAVTYLRFLAEAIGVDTIFFSASQGGPVYPFSEEVALQINATVGENLLQNLPRESLDLESAAKPVAKDLAEELLFLDPARIKTDAILEPQFSTGESPDMGLHEWLKGSSTAEEVMALPNSRFSNLLLEIFSDEAVAPQLEKVGMAGTETSRSQTLTLTATTRLLLYLHAAKEIDAQYLPGADRIQLHSLPAGSAKLNSQVTDLLLEQELPEDRFSLSEVIAAILRLSSGSPRKMLEEAASLRIALGSHRKHFQSHMPGDKLFAQANKARHVLSDIVKARLGVQVAPSLIRTFKPKVVFPGLPGVSLDVEKLAEWVDYKLTKKKVIAVAEVVVQGENYELSKSIHRFLKLTNAA